MSMRWANLVTVRHEDSASGADPVDLAKVLDAVRAELKVIGAFWPEAIAEAQAVAGDASLGCARADRGAFLTVVSRGSETLIRRAHRASRNASIVEVATNGALVQISDPTLLAPMVGECSAGAEVTVRLVEADVAQRSVRFQMAKR
jgi:hypothetical protein